MASDWPRTFFTARLFLFSISLTDGYDSQCNKNVTNVLLLYTRLNAINTGLKVMP